jgi:PIN domain nuclease of toxin-antitoxin system
MRGTLPPAVLLDTCTLIWIGTGAPLATAAIEAVFNAGHDRGIFVSPISAWEIGLLSRPGPRRASSLDFVLDPKAWLARIMANPGVRLAPFDQEIAVDASFLPGDLHNDPADRIIIATARKLGAPVVTRDRRIIDYARAGHVEVIPC